MNMDPDAPNIAPPSIATPQFTEGRKEGMFLPEAEEQPEYPSILENNSVTLENPIPKTLKEAYNNSFVSLPRPETLSKFSQGQLLEHVAGIKNVAAQILEDTAEEAQVKVAAQMLATNEAFIKQAQRQYQLYFAPGAIHEEQTDQNDPTIRNELAENKFDKEGLQSAFMTVKNIAIKALINT